MEEAVPVPAGGSNRQTAGGHFAGAGGNGDSFTAGGAFNLRAGAGLIHRQFLIAIRAVKNNVHIGG